jgi:tetratricopeptide (TPR) repeat protein
MVYVADRYMLIPTLGLALVVAAAVWNTRALSQRSKWILVGALAFASSVRTLDAQSNWRDDLTLWERAVESDPDNGDAWSMYVQALASANAMDAARAALDEGLARKRSPRLVMRKATMLIANGERAAGLALMREAAEANEPRAMSNLALLLEEDGKRAEALELARRAAGIPLAHAHRVHGKVALASGLAQEAVDAFQRAYDLEPTHPQNQYNLALALIATRRANDALEYLILCAKSPQTAAPCRAELARFKRR